MSMPDILLEAVRLRFSLKVLTMLDLGDFPGNTIRSGLGARFRDLVCMTGMSLCNHCSLKAECSYPQLFEAGYSPTGNEITGFENAPKPYVIHFPFIIKPVWRHGETLHVDLILLGPAVSYIPYLVISMMELGKTGLGKGWKNGAGRYELVGLSCMANGMEKQILSQIQKGPDALPTPGPIASLLEEEEKVCHSDSLKMVFQTPLRLRKQKKWIGSRDLQAYHIVEALFRRVRMMEAIYGRGTRFDASEVRALSENIEIVEKKVTRNSVSRYSARSKQSMPMDGLVGEIRLTGLLTPLLPVLQMGTLLHIGKGATMGMGQYRVYT